MDTKEAKYFNRDLSWIDFNARVLAEGLRPELPPLERLKFLAIVSSNFDEFFMVRIAALKRAAAAGYGRDPSGLTPEEQLSAAAAKIRTLVFQQYACLTSELLPQLAAAGLELVRPGAYTPIQQQFLESFFNREVFPNLTPLRVEEDAPFPTIGNLKLHAVFLLNGEIERVAIVQIPAALDRIIWLPEEESGRKRWALLDDVVLTFGHRLFPGHAVRESMLVKITRDADFSVDEERDEDFIEAMTEVLADRERSKPVRMSYSSDSPRLRDILAQRLELGRDDLYEMPGPIDLRTLFELTTVRGFDHLREEPWKNYWPLELPQDEPLWDRIRQEDVLVHLPYQSFDPFIKLLQDASSDPQVVSIKMTLYRTSGDSPVVRALERAAQKGKHVTALVELKARFDEERNITWANRMEEAGVIVVYGLSRLKVHAKACAIVRKESDGVRRYVHLSTGNYNDRTAKLYGDIALFTAREDIAYDVNLFFNMITGYSAVLGMKNLVAAPTELKHRLLALIERETKRSGQQYPGLIVAKMNSLGDTEIIDALYRASRAGVRVDLNVRGICMLRPGVPGLSENIRVVSIVDRYLEHSRVFYFANGGSDEVYLSSADWMPRNLERRVELMFPVRQKNLKEQLVSMLKLYFQDSSRARVLDSKGEWTLKGSEGGAEVFRVQEYFHRKVKEAAEAALSAPKQEFVVRRRPAAEKE